VPNCVIGTAGNADDLRLNFRFLVEAPDQSTLNNQYKRTTVTQASTKPVRAGTTTVPILRANVVTEGHAGTLISLTNIRFNNKSTAPVTAARLYYTGDNDAFSPATLLATINNPTLTQNIQFAINRQLAVGNNYF